MKKPVERGGGVDNVARPFTVVNENRAMQRLKYITGHLRDLGSINSE